jgi:putative two-component system response regulator
MQKKILVVDDEPNNLQLLRQILKDHYQLIFAADGESALKAARKHLPDLVLLDISMPGMDGYQVCLELKADRLTTSIPVIFVTALGEVENEARGFDVGGADYILKPISKPIVLRRIQTHLSLVRMQEFEEVQREAVYMLGTAGHYSDTDTGSHIWRMSAYARALALASGWSSQLAERLELAAPMHDIGKIGIPDAILKAPRKLNPEEWAIMQSHSNIGFDILSHSHTALFVMAKEIARHHHERWDGTGYPDGLKGNDIPESARIIALADVFDALTTKRPYKTVWSIEDALQEIQRNAGGHFEPRLVNLFIEILPEILRIKDEWDHKSK